MDLTLLAHIGWVAVAAGLMAGPVRAEEPPPAENPLVHPEELGSLPKGFKVGILRLSSDGKHFAGVIVRGDKWTVYVDGEAREVVIEWRTKSGFFGAGETEFFVDESPTDAAILKKGVRVRVQYREALFADNIAILVRSLKPSLKIHKALGFG